METCREIKPKEELLSLPRLIVYIIKSRDDWIRTSDHTHPMRVRYQTAPHPELDRVMSGWQDSNLRPPAPKAGAMTGLRYTPKKVRANISFLKNRSNRISTIFNRVNALFIFIKVSDQDIEKLLDSFVQFIFFTECLYVMHIICEYNVYNIILI